VDASSPTGATRLYERAGMTVYRDTVFLDRPARGSLGPLSPSVAVPVVSAAAVLVLALVVAVLVVVPGVRGRDGGDGRRRSRRRLLLLRTRRDRGLRWRRALVLLAPLRVLRASS
jgi:hypothetical protein